MSDRDIVRRDEIVDEPDPLAALPSDYAAEAVEVFSRALDMIKVMRRHREVLGECLHCGSPDFCDVEGQVFGLMSSVGEQVQGSLNVLGVLASGRSLRALDDVSLPSREGVPAIEAPTVTPPAERR